MKRKLSPVEVAENDACADIAEAVACNHSPARTEFDKGALQAADQIAARIRARKFPPEETQAQLISNK